jgi:hypothetical protein
MTVIAFVAFPKNVAFSVAGIIRSEPQTFKCFTLKYDNVSIFRSYGFR